MYGLEQENFQLVIYAPYMTKEKAMNLIQKLEDCNWDKHIKIIHPEISPSSVIALIDKIISPREEKISNFLNSLVEGEPEKLRKALNVTKDYDNEVKGNTSETRST